MDIMKQQIQQTLISNVLKEKCRNNSALLFDESWCSQNRTVRFTTPFFHDYFEASTSQKGKWGVGVFVMYEVKVGYDSWEAACVFNSSGLPKSETEDRNKLLGACNISAVAPDEDIILRRWFSSSGEDLNQLFDEFDDLLVKKVPLFESALIKTINEGASTVGVKEGEEKYITLTTYERNPVARRKCLGAHGTACAVCGIDFGKVYGPQFAGKIEVHHIVPISQIGKEYIVDPVNDLIPVCPNCHTALHSKKDGVYTVEELKKMMGK